MATISGNEKHKTINAQAKKPSLKKSTLKKRRSSTPISKPLELNMNYSVQDAVNVVGASAITLWRAIAAGHLETYRIGRKRLVSGEQLKRWLENGGKTSGKGGRKDGQH